MIFIISLRRLLKNQVETNKSCVLGVVEILAALTLSLRGTGCYWYCETALRCAECKEDFEDRLPNGRIKKCHSEKPQALVTGADDYQAARKRAPLMSSIFLMFSPPSTQDVED